VLKKAVDALPGEVDLAFRAATGVTWENGTLIHESSSCRVDRTPLEQVEAKIAGRPGSTLIELTELWGEEGVLENFDEWCTNGKNFVPASRCPHDGSDSQYTLQCACCLHERGLTKLQYEANCGEPDFICADVGMQCMQRIVCSASNTNWRSSAVLIFLNLFSVGPVNFLKRFLNSSPTSFILLLPFCAGIWEKDRTCQS
jgi:hypothetical protein